MLDIIEAPKLITDADGSSWSYYALNIYCWAYYGIISSSCCGNMIGCGIYSGISAKLKGYSELTFIDASTSAV